MAHCFRGSIEGVGAVDGRSDGAGVKEAGEQCDDGNTIDTDACSNACRIAVCGDGI